MTEKGMANHFNLDMSGQVANELKHLKKLGKQMGLGKEVVQALRKIIQRLQKDPLKFGEIAETFEHLQLQVRAAVVHPLMVRFAIHEEKRLVFIMKVQFLSS